MMMPTVPFTVSVVLSSKEVVSTRVVRKLGQYLYLDPLRDYEAVLTPPCGAWVRLVWSDEDGAYDCEGTVTEILSVVPIIVIALTGNPRSIEQRARRRIAVAVGLDYAMLRADAEHFLTATRDLSADGLRFFSAWEPWKELHLRMRLILASGDVSLLSKVTRVGTHPQEVRGKPAWDTAVSFMQITGHDRACIEQFVQAQYQRQRQRKHRNS